MDLAFSEADEEFRRELRAFLERAVPREDPPEDLDAEFDYRRRFQRAMHAGGFVGIHWPREYGDRSATPLQQAIFAEELAPARAPQLVNRVGINNVGPTLMHFGTEEHKRRFLPGILSADEIWCQLYSEPGAGSDLAALRTRADLDGDDLRREGVFAEPGAARASIGGEQQRQPPAPKGPVVSPVLVHYVVQVRAVSAR
jgi:alkylation response protein AidB-like acyl-CoA dehydrogenase